jgi:hypothetical protein
VEDDPKVSRTGRCEFGLLIPAYGRRQHGVRIGVAIGRAIKLCQRQREENDRSRGISTTGSIPMR